MPHIIRVGSPCQCLNRVRIACDIRTHKLPFQTKPLDWPTRPIEAHKIGDWIILWIRGLETRKFHLIHKERAIYMQMLNRAHRQRSKSLGVLVLCANTFAQQVVKRLIKRNWYQISCLNGTLGIYHRITKRQRHILNRRECEHICRHKLIHWAVVLEHAIGGLFYVIIGRICDIRHQPSMEIVELEPLAWCQLQRNHRRSRRTLREDIRGMISISPLDILALDTDTTPPCV